jgi:hypothetical protein
MSITTTPEKLWSEVSGQQLPSVIGGIHLSRFLYIFYSWRGFNTPRLCRGHKGIKPETNTL